jgi:predicted metal-binding transcription factor (methanogenesis marker protein 9)
MEYLDLPMDAQIKLAEYDGMTREEYIKWAEYLANETMEQFEERLKTMPPSKLTKEEAQAFAEKMSSGY